MHAITLPSFENFPNGCTLLPAFFLAASTYLVLSPPKGSSHFCFPSSIVPICFWAPTFCTLVLCLGLSSPGTLFPSMFFLLSLVCFECSCDLRNPKGRLIIYQNGWYASTIF
jgi:hypothetical protein